MTGRMGRSGIGDGDVLETFQRRTTELGLLSIDTPLKQFGA